MTDFTQEIHQLKHKIFELEQELSLKSRQLENCLNNNCSDSEQSQELLTEYNEIQNEFYLRYKICDANWSEIPAGEFYHAGQAEKLSAFAMLSTPVTFEMYDLYCASSSQQPPGDDGWGRENRPVININYQNARDYARWISEQTGWKCQLPTEQQWEYACRARTVTNYWYGDMPDPRMMVMGTGKTMPTPGPRLANPWNLYDMHGNVWEWTSSCRSNEYILCGGSWYNKANWLTSSARNISYPDYCNNNWGFRIIRATEI